MAAKKKKTVVKKKKSCRSDIIRDVVKSLTAPAVLATVTALIKEFRSGRRR